MVKKIENRNRPILLGFISFRLKLLALQNTYKLKGSNIFIAEDFPKEVIEIRKRLQTQLVSARQAGNYVVLQYDRLIIKEGQPFKKNKKRLISSSPSQPECIQSEKLRAPTKKNKFDLKPSIKSNSEQPGSQIESGGLIDRENSTSKRGSTKSGI